MSLKALPAHVAQVKPGRKCTEAKLRRIPAAKFLKYIYLFYEFKQIILFCSQNQGAN